MLQQLVQQFLALVAQSNLLSAEGLSTYESRFSLPGNMLDANSAADLLVSEEKPHRCLQDHGQ